MLADLQSYLDTLREKVAAFAEPGQPTKEELAIFWDDMLGTEAAMIASPTICQAWRRGCAAFLAEETRFCAGSSESVTRTWRRNRQRWTDRGRNALALMDGRRAAGRRRRGWEIPKEDFDRIVNEARYGQFRGRVAPAIRTLANEGKLSPETVRHVVRSKGKRIPTRHLQRIEAEVRRLRLAFKSHRDQQINGASTTRDWRNTPANRWWQGDDLTPPVIFYRPDGDWFSLIRGQFLPMIDLRSKYVIHAKLVLARNYNASSVRQLILGTADSLGCCPHEGFYLESGTWRARLVEGERLSLASGVPGRDIHDWAETRLGLEEFFKFKRATSPGAKPVENVLGLLQNRMEGIPGYCGRNERTDFYERVQKAQQLVRSKHAHPAEFFLSEDEVVRMWHDLLEDYNQELQPTSRMTFGRSPAVAWQEFQDPNPPVAITAEIRCLLASHRWVEKVKWNGVRNRYFKDTVGQPCWYGGEMTSCLEGEEVMLWFDPGHPEYLFITDLDRRNPQLVPLRSPLDADSHDREQIREAIASRNACNSYPIIRDIELRHKFKPAPRHTILDVESRELTGSMRRQAQEHDRQKQHENRQRQRFERTARKSRLPRTLITTEADNENARRLEKYRQ